MENFRNLFEAKLDIEQKREALYNLVGVDSKADLVMWGWFEDNMGDIGIYAGDAVPEDFLEAMDPRDVEKCYDFMYKKFKNIMK